MKIKIHRQKDVFDPTVELVIQADAQALHKADTRYKDISWEELLPDVRDFFIFEALSKFNNAGSRMLSSDESERQ